MLPADSKAASEVMNLARKGYYLVSGVLYYEGPDMPGRRLVVPCSMRGGYEFLSTTIDQFLMQMVTLQLYC